MKRKLTGLLSLLAFVMVLSCKKDKTEEAPYDEVKQAAIDEQTIKDHIAKNNLTGFTRDTTGVYFKVLEHGAAVDTIKLTDRFRIGYTGKLLNGTQFDSNTSTTFDDARLGTPGLIAGFKVGPLKTTKGGTVQYFIPSVLGYRNRQMGDIPPNSVLIFEVKLIDYYY